MNPATLLIGSGFFPETLPPCFTSTEAAKHYPALADRIEKIRLKGRGPSLPISYNCTKHNFSRRIFATPNLLNYFFIAQFIEKNWKEIETFLSNSKFSASTPKFSDDINKRSISITSFHDLDRLVHSRLRFSPYVLKADVSNFFPGIYTHSIPWALHTKNAAKADRERGSKKILFNELDYHLRNCQDGQTRGVLIGPDASRIISELVLCAVDEDLLRRTEKFVVGAVRHVDDYYIGVRSPTDAQAVLSELRQALYEYELLLNDTKTKVLSTAAPMEAGWPLQLHRLCEEVFAEDDVRADHIDEIFGEALRAANQFEIQSPIKLVLRNIDKHNLEQDDEFAYLEPYLLRFIHHYPHSIDYVCMLVGSRVLNGGAIDNTSWKEVANTSIVRYSKLYHHHEVAWLFWLSVISGIDISEQSLKAMISTGNGHLIAMIVAAAREELIPKIPEIEFPKELDVRDPSWLHHYEAVVSGLSMAKLRNDEADIYKELIDKKVFFVQYGPATERLRDSETAISDIRFGYDSDEEDESEQPF